MGLAHFFRRVPHCAMRLVVLGLALFSVAAAAQQHLKIEPLADQPGRPAVDVPDACSVRTMSQPAAFRAATWMSTDWSAVDTRA